MSAIRESKGVCLEVFQNTETDLENVIYEKRLRRLGLLNQKKKKKREGEGLKEGFINRKNCCKKEKKTTSSLHVVNTTRDNSVKLSVRKILFWHQGKRNSIVKD